MAAGTEEELASPSDTEGTGAVLVVDDNAAMRDTLVRILTSEGYSVVAAGDGREAFSALAEHAFDLVITDVQMPDVDGVELLRSIRQTDTSTSVLLVSGAPNLDMAIEGMKLGATDFLVKPVDPSAIAERVAHAVERTKTAREQEATLRRARSSPASAPQSAGPQSAEAPGSWTGVRLSNRYLVGKELGAGGMSTVYEARREDLGGMSVALKLLRQTLSEDPEVLARFRREAETIASLNHPNIVRVLDFEVSLEGPAYIVMEKLEGHSLAALIQAKAPLEPGRVAFIAVQVLLALSVAHEHHIIHRDLKPENVFLTSISGFDDIVRVLDFGIAKILDDDSSKLTRDGAVIGTPAYMAPEQARGENLDARGDLYSVGVLMYESLVGRPPFHASNLHALLGKIFAGRFDPLGALRPDLNADLVAVVEKAMSTNRANRYDSAQQMIEALEPFLPLEAKGIVGVGEPLAPTTNPTIGHFKTTVAARKH